MTAYLQHTQHSFNMSSIMASSNIKTPLFDWGINRSYEECVNLHVPSGEHNGLVASIIMAEKRGEKFIKMSSDTPFDVFVCSAQSAIKENQTEEKHLSASIQKIKDELSHHTVNSSDSEPEEVEVEDDEEVVVAELNVRVQKTLKNPKQVQKFLTQKQKAEAARKRKGLLSSLNTQSIALAEVRAKLAEQRIFLGKQEALQTNCRLLNKGLLGAERSYCETHDQDFLVKNVHHNMAVWAKKSEPLLPPVKMVQRLMGSPGAFQTVMVPEYPRSIVPLSEFLREDW